jgi:vacuolar-type H+-ATPase subunit E/Vma4
MEQEVARRCERVLVDARREADSIVETADRDSAAKREEALRRLEDEVRELAEQSRTRARGEAALETLTFQQETADDVLHRVEAELRRIAGSDAFPDILDALLAEVLEAAPEGDLVVEVPADYVDRCRDQVRDTRRVDVQAVPALTDGVVARDKKQLFRFVNTLSSRFAGSRDNARRLCIDRLFGRKAAAHE